MPEFVLLVGDTKQVKFDLACLKKLGEGGEGYIYAAGENQCIKIFNNPDADKITAVTHAAKTSRHVWRALNEIAAVPLFLVYDETGTQVRGYGMRRLDGWHSLGDIMTKDGAKKAGVGMKETAQIFLALQRAVALIHQQKFVIGDFNSSNVLFQKSKVMLIDTDSWSINRPDLGLAYFPGLTDEMELYHPDFINADIGDEDGKQLPHPQVEERHDWWSFSYLFWKALTKHDPFGVGAGDVPADRDERIVNAITSTDSGLSFETNKEAELAALRLGPAMLNTLNRFLELKFQKAFPALLIEQFMDEICTCPQCEEEMSCSAVFCPGCLNKIPD